MKPSGIVTLLTDFGLDDAYVGAMKGAVLAVHARTTLIDVTHGVRPFAVLQGAFLLDTAWSAQVLHCDHFGNVISNLPLRALARIKAVNGTRVRTVETYDEAEPNELVALMGSSSRIEFALREGSAAARLHTAPGETLLVT